MIWFGIEVGRDVDVGRQQQLDDLLLAQVLVQERHVVVEIEALDHGEELVAVLLTAVAQKLGVGLAGDQVERFGVSLRDPRHRFDHVLESLARPDEAERGDDLAARESELLLQLAASTRLDVGHAVLDHARRCRHSVHVAQDVDRRSPP